MQPRADIKIEYVMNKLSRAYFLLLSLFFFIYLT
nr:MAG TPA: hypothetical protein [Caudoviricetes sp.]